MSRWTASDSRMPRSKPSRTRSTSRSSTTISSSSRGCWRASDASTGSMTWGVTDRGTRPGPRHARGSPPRTSASASRRRRGREDVRVREDVQLRAQPFLHGILDRCLPDLKHRGGGGITRRLLVDRDALMPGRDDGVARRVAIHDEIESAHVQMAHLASRLRPPRSAPPGTSFASVSEVPPHARRLLPHRIDPGDCIRAGR